MSVPLPHEYTPPPCSQPQNVVVPSPVPSSSGIRNSNSIQYPPIKQLLDNLHADKPEWGFDKLENDLVMAGFYTADQVIIPPESVLMFLGDMGLARARALRNYARHLVLPILGLPGNYNQPEIDLSKQTDEMHSDEVASAKNKEGSVENDKGSENGYEGSENSENSDEDSDGNEEVDGGGGMAGWLAV